MTPGELAEREMVSGNRVRPAGLLRTLRRQLISEVQRADNILISKDERQKCRSIYAICEDALRL
jgi:hypothetical protein